MKQAILSILTFILILSQVERSGSTIISNIIPTGNIFITNINKAVASVEKGEVQNIHVSCGESEYWNSLKPGLESLNKRLNGSWGVNVIDRDGRTTNLATGSNGTVTYKYSKTGNNWEAEISGISDSEVRQIITDAIQKKLDAFQIDENGKSKVASTTDSSFSTEDGGEFRFGDGLHWYDWGPVLCDAGSSIWESSRLPETYWNQSNPKYNDYPLHTAPTFTGIADGIVEEITAIPQLVKLGLEVVTNKEMALAFWESVKDVSVESIIESSVAFYEQKKENYTSDKSYIVSYTIGKDVTELTTYLMGTGFFKKGTDGLKNGIKETGENLAKKGKHIEKILPKVDTYEQARNQAFEILGDIGNDSKPHIGRLERSKGYGKITGRSSADNKKLWRVDYDSEKGVHINIENYSVGKGEKAEKYVISFNGDEQTFETILKTLNK